MGDLPVSGGNHAELNNEIRDDMMIRGALFCSVAFAAGSLSAVDFAQQVFPVLQRACFECHGQQKAESDLRLDVPAAATHESIKSGDLLRRIQLPADHEDAMPRRGNRLSAPQVAIIRGWIESGAIWPSDMKPPVHWAYVKPRPPTVPTTMDTAWPRNDVDKFILARLEAEKMQPSSEASPAVLLRRLSLDTRGLPPSVAEVEAFEKEYHGSGKEAAWSRWVDKFLADKAFGPKWARHWLDLARYADSHGFQRDDLRNVWAFRDWVVNALNDGMPFDQFTIEQVAGDLLPNASPSQIIATGFHRCTPTNVEAGTDPEESRINQVIDRVNTTGAVWLGTTLECAQCHNHKYDPFTMQDYYGLLAYFNNTEKEAERTNPKVPGSIQFKGSPFNMLSKELEDKSKALREQIAKLEGTTPASEATTALKPDVFEAESGSENTILPDNSVLLTGDAPDVDTYVFEASLKPMSMTGILIEALADESLPGNGPGRGSAQRPNFVLTDLEAAIGQKLSFAKAYASHSQTNMHVNNLLDDDPQSAWAINPKFGQTHWVALELARPVEVTAGAKLSLRLLQDFGGKRTIGRLRVTALSEPVPMCLPEVDDVSSKKPNQRLAALKKQLVALESPTTEVMKELAQPRMTTMFKRGDWQQPAEPVMAGTPAVFGAQANGAPNRLTLARWLVSEGNPLTARVTVNRWWAEIFGQGIVSTVEDFGIKGEPPSHPELLDFLAVKLMRNGWSMKTVLKQIFESATYRQASSIPSPNLDPMNVLLARGPRFRLDAEGIRDNALAIAGLLSQKLGGQSIRPPQPDGIWTKVGGQNYPYNVSEGEDKYRRGIYVVLKRGSPYPSMVNFDASARMACVVKRSRSNTPLQALTLLNDPVYVEAAAAFAQRVQREASAMPLKDQLRLAFRLAVSREPTQTELQVLDSLYADTGKWLSVATALLNLDETITKP
ncbi:MAG: PSD1 domain-containing protein [Verrucomicrobiaceae bacterium]|nr:PSD1 domain-containing protein [Verrucomicrobiaceae bacterium]